MKIAKIKPRKISKKLNKTDDNIHYKIESLIERASDDKIGNSFTLEQLRHSHSKSYIYILKHNNSSDLNKIKKNLSESEKELLSRINEFKKNFIKFNKKKLLNMKFFHDLQKSNDEFTEGYHSIQNQKNKKNRIEDTFMANEYFFKIANKYLLNKIKLPNMSKNVFKSNPLIENKEKLHDYFKYNLNDSGKFLNYIEKLKNMVKRKIRGNYKLSLEEKERLQEIINKEKPKGYIPPDILIPMLQNDIAKSQNTYDNLIKEYKINNKNKINTINEKQNFNMKNNFFSTIKFNSIRKVNNTNENNNNINNNEINKNKNENNNTNDIFNNNNSLETTTIPVDTKINISKTPRYNIFSRKNSKTTVLIPSRLKKLKCNTTKFTFNDNEINLLYFKKNLDLMLNDKNNKSINMILKNNRNNFGLEKEENSTFLPNNKIEFFTPRKTTDSFKFTNDKLEIEKEKKIQKPDIFIKKIFTKTSAKNLGFKNIFSNSFKTNTNETLDKSNIKKKLDFFEKKMSQKYKTQKEKEEEKYQNVEKLYNKALKLKNNSYQEQYELESYISKGRKNLSQIINLKNTYYNINYMKNVGSKNFILKSYSMRHNNKIRIQFTDRQNKILYKNKKFIQDFNRNVEKFTNVIFQKNKNEE